MPKPSAAKTSSATGAFCVNANPSAGPMNGAVHGLATSVASAPVKNEPSFPPRSASVVPRPMKPAPILTTPASASAIAVNR